MSCIGWRLDPRVRSKLLKRLVPAWPDVIANHMTLDMEAEPDAPLPEARQAKIVGAIDDGEGVQALVVSIAGATQRPDGGTYHITWSIDALNNRRSIQSNGVIARLGWRAFDKSVDIEIIPTRLDHIEVQ